MKLFLCKVFISIPLIVGGVSTILLGISCTLAGPDPDVGPGKESITVGLSFILFGSVAFCIGRYIFKKSENDEIRKLDISLRRT